MEWPGKETDPTPKGYLYIVFEDESCVKDLLNQCAQEGEALFIRQIFCKGVEKTLTIRYSMEINLYLP